MNVYKILLATFMYVATTHVGVAQNAQVAFGSIQSNSGLPVEVTADNLSVDQNTGTAVFSDNVIIVQGEMRLSADQVIVVYGNAGTGIQTIEATGNVILISGEDAAESEQAQYDVNSGTIEMTGNVLVAQGPSALTAESMTVNLSDGTAQMSGRVKTILQPDNQ